MTSSFQTPETLRGLYSNPDQIAKRGRFLKTYSNRKYGLYDFILKLVPEIVGSHVLDFGCGSCVLLRKLRQRYPRNVYCGLDVVENSGCSSAGFVDYRIYDGRRFPSYQRNFDFVFCTHVLYHVADLSETLGWLRESLSTNGMLVISTKSKFTLPHMELIFQRLVERHALGSYGSIPVVRDEAHFCAENAVAILQEIFPARTFSLESYLLETQLIVDNPDHVVEYVLSTPRFALRGMLPPSAWQDYVEEWREEVAVGPIFMDKYVENVLIIQKRRQLGPGAPSARRGGKSAGRGAE